MKYVAELIVRSYECDSYGHVNNAVYLNYLEYGRMELLHQIHFDYKSLVAEGFYLYITHIDIKYKASAFLDDKLLIETESIKLGAVSGTFRQIVRKDNGLVCAEADVTWASVKSGAKLTRLPEKYMLPELFPEKIKN